MISYLIYFSHKAKFDLNFLNKQNRPQRVKLINDGIGGGKQKKENKIKMLYQFQNKFGVFFIIYF